MSERVPSATATEVVAAIVRGNFPSLLLVKRLSLPAATAALRELEGFLGKEDNRLNSLRETVNKLSATPLRTKVARQIGESVVYKTQRPSAKKSAHVVVPINVLETAGPLSRVRVTFERDRIVITQENHEHL